MSRRDHRYRPGPWRDSYVPYDRRDDYYDRYYPHEDQGYYNDRYHDLPSRYEYEDDRAWYGRRGREDSRRYYSTSRYNEPSSSYSLYNSEPLTRLRSRSPPREPAAMRHRDDRDDRSVTPPPVRPPSPTYLALSEEKPSTLAIPSEERKLLILDLNGTLVHRAPYTRPKNKYEPPPVDETGKPLPRLRPVHPRPYMPAFRQYLFSPETNKWLDVMIWSSAQPHSVNDMVDKCFGGEKEKLVAVWARDTLGLSSDQYNKKVQTLKDLTTPWTKLSALLNRTEYRSRSPTPPRASSPRADRSFSAPPPPSSSSPLSSPTALEPPSVHSALTTLLLDDSPAKAARQPYNHVCLPEYSAETRARDLELLHSARRREAELQDAEVRAESSSDATPPAEAEPAAKTTEQLEDANGEGSKKRKRKNKKEMKQAAKRAQHAAVDEANAGKPYDETLLAVVGVLDAVREQRNVAAWIRAGGLWGPHLSPLSHETAPPPSTEGAVEDSAGAVVNSPASGNDAASSPDAAQANVVEGTTEEKTPQALWFEHAPTLEFWVARGRQALVNLGIPVEHGIER